MLIETFDYAVSNRQKILSKIDFKSHEVTIEKAKRRWTEFQPARERYVELAGIDSSWNFIPYQGFYVYAVDAVTMLEDGSYLVPPVFDVSLSTLAVHVVEHDKDLDQAKRDTWVSNPSVALESIGMEYEYEQARASIGTEKKIGFVLVDGSILARFYDRKRGTQSSYYDYAR